MNKTRYTVVLDSVADADVIAAVEAAGNRSAWLADACRRKVRELPALDRVLARLETMSAGVPRSGCDTEPQRRGPAWTTPSAAWRACDGGVITVRNGTRRDSELL